MKKYLVLIVLVYGALEAQTVQKRVGLYPNGECCKVFNDTTYDLPNLNGRYWTGYGTFGSLADSVRPLFSVTNTGTGNASYNSATGTFNFPLATSSSGNAFVIGGNTLANSGSQYLGTNNLTSLRVFTNGVQRMLIDSLGNTRLDGTNSGDNFSVYSPGNSKRFSVSSSGGVTSAGGYTIDATNFWGSNRMAIGVNNAAAITAIKNNAANKYSLLLVSTNSNTDAAVGDSGFAIGASVSYRYKAVASSYTASMVDHTINVDATSAPFTITLPSAALSGFGISGLTVGRTYVIRKADASGNAVTVATTGSQTINGAITYTLSSQYKYVSLQSDGANWMVIGNN